MIFPVEKDLNGRAKWSKKNWLIDLYSHQPFPSANCLEKNDLPTSCGKPTSFEKTTSHWKNFFSPNTFNFI